MLVDDHPLWRQTLRQVLESKRAGVVVSEVSDGAEAVEAARAARPDVVVMDLDLPVMGGIEATRRLIAAIPEIKVLVLSSFDERSSIVEAIKAGASGYLLKTAASSEIVDAIRRIELGELVFPSSVAPVVLEELRAADEALLRVVVADDSVVRREGLARLLNESRFEVVGTDRFSELRTMLVHSKPQVAIANVGGGPHGAKEALEAARQARTTDPGIAMLLLADDVETPDPTDLLSERSSAIGYLLTHRISDIDELTDSIRRVAAGEAVIDPEVFDHLMRRRRSKTPLDELTQGERDVLALMAEGRSNQAISQALFLSPKTVEARVGSIFAKLGLELAPDDHRRVLAVLTYVRSTTEA